MVLTERYKGRQKY